jgi:tetraacyldisaccharide 4'-kinase
MNASGATTDIEQIAGVPVAGFCGIGNPDSFRRTLTSLGAELRSFRTYPDHHAYTRDDIERLRQWASGLAKECAIVTTQKDLVKLRLNDLGGRLLWALRIGIHVNAGQEALDQKLWSLVA